MAEEVDLDLICREVIVEDQIEPPAAVVLNKLSQLHSRYAPTPNARTPSQFLEREERAVTPGTFGIRCSRSKKYSLTVTPQSRRKFGGRGHVASRLDFSVNDGIDYKHKETEVYEDPVHSVLPIEVRWHILKCLSLPELLPLRRVSKAWRSTINSLLKVDVRITGNANHFRGGCTLPIRCCHLVSIQNPTYRQLFQSPEPEVVRISRGISSINFEEMVLQWTFLTKLELCWRSTMKNLLFGKRPTGNPLSLKTALPSLNHLKLEILINDNLGKLTQFRIFSNVASLTGFDYPSLNNFSIIFVGYRELHAENRFLSLILPFLSRHAKSLHTIDFSLKYTSHVLYPPAHPRHILFCVPANIRSNYKAPQTSFEGHLITTQLRKNGSAPEHHEEWIGMLENTRKLEVSIMTRFLSWSIRHLDFFKPTIREYSKFLRRVDIMNVTMYDSGAHNTVTQLDAKIFSGCVQLTELRLYRAPIIFHEDEVEPAAELVNLNKLPKTIEEIIIDGLPVSSAELLILINEYRNLKSFNYFQSQVPRRNMLWGNGVNWEILKAILKHQRLASVKVHISSLGQSTSHVQYEEPLKQLALENGWTSSGIVTGYMNMFQVTLTKPHEKM